MNKGLRKIHCTSLTMVMKVKVKYHHKSLPDLRYLVNEELRFKEIFLQIIRKRLKKRQYQLKLVYLLNFEKGEKYTILANHKRTTLKYFNFGSDQKRIMAIQKDHNLKLICKALSFIFTKPEKK